MSSLLRRTTNGLRDYGHDGQIGLEETPEKFVARLVEVFREVRRILRDDGVVWVNMGDSYAGSWGNYGGQNRGNGTQRKIVNGSAAPNPAWDGREQQIPPTARIPGLKPKDLIGVPWMLAFALRADGWYLRSDCIWHKPNPMPESVTDRPTKAHEYLFLLTKAERYFYDADAISEAASCAGGYAGYAGYAERAESMGREPSGNEKPGVVAINAATRNRRTVWTISTHSYDEAHFATYPPALVEPCIKAGTSERGCCAECGAPWVRVVNKERVATRPGDGSKVHGRENLEVGNRDPQRHVTESRTVGWNPTCTCGAAVVPCRVFDPFTGSGTTLAVANQLGRDAEGSELNPEYKAMAERRIAKANRPTTYRDMREPTEASGLFSN